MTVVTSSHYAIDRFIGESAWAERIRKRVLQVARYNYSVLITGPSGTGKEVVARAIHAHSDRHAQPFVPVNCAAIPQTLFSSQLFGHVKGAFTGAQFAALGCFRAAEGGTIFLDEIGELDLECQAKLLRVLQERVVVPVGGHDGVAVNVRTVAATNRDLLGEVRAGRFRLDLYYRLNVLSVETQALKDRPEDIGPLARHFLAKTAIECGMPLKRLTDEALECLKMYDWPGNVRELENFIERAVVHSEGDLLGPEDFPDLADLWDRLPGPRDIGRPGLDNTLLDSGGEPLTDGAAFAGESSPSRKTPSVVPPQQWSDEDWPSLEDVEREHIARTLHRTYFNQSAAARLLRIDRKLLARKVKKYGIPMSTKR